MGTPGSSKLRRLGKWSALTLLALTFLALILLVGGSLVRQSTLENNQARLGKNIERVTAEICGGKPVPTWYRKRVRGTNGWDHLRFIDEARLADEDHQETWGEPTPAVRLWWALEDLVEWDGSTWTPRLETGAREPGYVREPPSDVIAKWIEETNPVAAAYAEAAKCDVVSAIPPASDGSFRGYVAIPVIDRLHAAVGMLGRNKALRSQGKIAQADTEFLHFVQTWTKYDLPLNMVDHMVGLGLAGTGFARAERMLIRGEISPEAATAITRVDFNCEKWLRAATEGELAWMAGNATYSGWVLSELTLLGWLSKTPPAGEGLFEAGEMLDSPKSRFVAPLNITREINIAIEAGLDSMSCLDGDSVRAPSAPKPHEASMMAMAPSHLYKSAINCAMLRHKQIALRLRLLQAANPDLSAQRAAIEEMVAKFRQVTLTWGGEDIVLGVSPQLIEWFLTADDGNAELTAQDLKDLVRSTAESAEYVTRIEPLAKAKENLAD